jgi:polar amino acid transport system substrate-binding protein
MAFDGLIPALLTQKIDMVAACMSVTSERSKKVNFSDPYIITYSAFVTPADNETIKGIDDLKGKKVSVQLGTTEDLHVSTIEGVEVKKFNKLDDAVREVTLGRVDAAFMDEPVAKDYVGSKQFEGKLKVAFTIEIEGAPKALALNKEDTELLEKVNKALAEAKEEGLIEKLNEKWNQ